MPTPTKSSSRALLRRLPRAPAGSLRGVHDRLLACPLCRSALSPRNDAIECGGCGASFGSVDGRPVLLPPPHRLTDGSLDDAGRAGAVRRVVRRLKPSLTYKPRATRGLAAEFVLSVDGPILNIGSGDTDYGPNVLNLDLYAARMVDVVGDAHHLPVRDAAVAGVILEAVLEHVENDRRVLEEIHRVLEPAGRVYVDVPFIQGIHTSSDHRRFTEAGLSAQLDRVGFEVERSGISVGPASGMAWVTAEFLALLLSGRSDLAYRFALVATNWMAWPLKFADVWLHGHPRAYLISSGVWVIARRR